MRRVVIMQAVFDALGQMLRTETPHGHALLLLILNRLREQLENHADRYRGKRDPEDVNLFDYVLQVADEDSTWHTFRFSVDDGMATDHLIVAAVSHQPGKGRI